MPDRIFHKPVNLNFQVERFMDMASRVQMMGIPTLENDLAILDETDWYERILRSSCVLVLEKTEKEVVHRIIKNYRKAVIQKMDYFWGLWFEALLEGVRKGNVESVFVDALKLSDHPDNKEAAAVLSSFIEQSNFQERKWEDSFLSHPLTGSVLRFVKSVEDVHDRKVERVSYNMFIAYRNIINNDLRMLQLAVNGFLENEDPLKLRHELMAIAGNRDEMPVEVRADLDFQENIDFLNHFLDPEVLGGGSFETSDDPIDGEDFYNQNPGSLDEFIELIVDLDPQSAEYLFRQIGAEGFARALSYSPGTLRVRFLDMIDVEEKNEIVFILNQNEPFSMIESIQSQKKIIDLYNRK